MVAQFEIDGHPYNINRKPQLTNSCNFTAPHAYPIYIQRNLLLLVQREQKRHFSKLTILSFIPSIYHPLTATPSLNFQIKTLFPNNTTLSLCLETTTTLSKHQLSRGGVDRSEERRSRYLPCKRKEGGGGGERGKNTVGKDVRDKRTRDRGARKPVARSRLHDSMVVPGATGYYIIDRPPSSRVPISCRDPWRSPG